MCRAQSPFQFARNRGRLGSLTRERLQCSDIFFRPLTALCLLPCCHCVPPIESPLDKFGIQTDCCIFATNPTTQSTMICRSHHLGHIPSACPVNCSRGIFADETDVRVHSSPCPNSTLTHSSSSLTAWA